MCVETSIALKRGNEKLFLKILRRMGTFLSDLVVTVKDEPTSGIGQVCNAPSKA